MNFEKKFNKKTTALCLRSIDFSPPLYGIFIKDIDALLLWKIAHNRDAHSTVFFIKRTSDFPQNIHTQPHILYER